MDKPKRTQGKVLPWRAGIPLLMGSPLPDDAVCRKHPDLCYTAMRVIDVFLTKLTRLQ